MIYRTLAWPDVVSFEDILYCAPRRQLKRRPLGRKVAHYKREVI
jgi:hypothetical protein